MEMIIHARRLCLIAVSMLVLQTLALTGCSHQEPNAEDDASHRKVAHPPPTPIQPERVAPPPVLRALPREPVSAPPQALGALSLPQEAIDKFKSLLEAEREAPVVVVQYGDSHTRAAIIASTMRDRLARQQTTSPGYLQPGHPMRWSASVSKHGSWHRHNWLYGKDEPSFGPLGLAYTTTRTEVKREPQTMKLTLTAPPPDGVKVTAYYLLENGHLPFELTSRRQTLQSVGPPKNVLAVPELGEVTVELPAGAKQLELVVKNCRSCSNKAAFRFFGFRVAYPDAKVEWDAMGIGGTTIHSPTRRSDGTMDDYLKRRGADLLVTWYGSNSSVAKGLDLQSYAAKFDDLLTRLKANSPGAACLVLGPPDLARRPDSSCFLTRDELRIVNKRKKTSADRKALRKNRSVRACNPDGLLSRKGGRVSFPVAGVRNMSQWNKYVQSCRHRTVPNIPAITNLQKELALKHGCGFFDVYAYMGGRDAILKWACEEPQLASTDLVHLTQDGYRKVGNAVFDALESIRHGSHPLQPQAPTPP